MVKQRRKICELNRIIAPIKDRGKTGEKVPEGNRGLCCVLGTRPGRLSMIGIMPVSLKPG